MQQNIMKVGKFITKRNTSHPYNLLRNNQLNLSKVNFIHEYLLLGDQKNYWLRRFICCTAK